VDPKDEELSLKISDTGALNGIIHVAKDKSMSESKDCAIGVLVYLPKIKQWSDPLLARFDRVEVDTFWDPSGSKITSFSTG